ncbi:MAG: insulinase family protein [Oscillospiraceae bacterium]|nr:insulinase family protein [Oscillospiraceae bacterium]
MLRAQLIDNIDSVINDKAVYASERAAKTAFVGEAAELPPSGVHENAEKITAKSAYDAYREMLRTAHVEICAVGCSEFSESERIFTEELSGLERSDICRLRHAPSALKDKPAYVEDNLEMQQVILRMYLKAPEMDDRPANAIFSCVLGGMTTSRFFMNIREKQSLCYYCSCHADRFSKTVACTAGIEPDNVEKTREAMLAEFKDICENGVSEDELEHAKLEFLNSLSSTYDSAFGISSWYLSQIIDEKFISPEEYAEQIKAVTAERVRDAARKYSLDTVYLLKNKDNTAL